MNKQKGLPHSLREASSAVEAGLAPILIVIIITTLVGGYFFYQNQTKPTPPPQQTTKPLLSSTPSPSLKLIATLQPTVSTKKPSPISKITPTPLPSPSPSTSPSPISKPSPVSEVYQLDLKPTSNIETSTSSYGYAASILLTDSNGDVVYDQSDISFSASIDNPDLARIWLDYDDGNQLCKLYNIKYEEGYHVCPNFRLDIVPKQAGSTKIPIKAIQKSTGKVVAEGAYSLTIK